MEEIALADAAKRLKRGNKLLFTRDSACLQELRGTICQQKHRTLVLWAFDCVSVPLQWLAQTYPNEQRPGQAVAPVSYTHLDVYKRQGTDHPYPAAGIPGCPAALPAQQRMAQHRGAGRRRAGRGRSLIRLSCSKAPRSGGAFLFRSKFVIFVSFTVLDRSSVPV